MVLASFLASWSFGLIVWPFSQFVLWPLLHMQRPKYKLEKIPNIKAKRQRGQKREAKRPRGQKWEAKRPKGPKMRGQNGTSNMPNTKPHTKKTCPSLSEASDRLSVPYQLSLFTQPDANDRLSVPHQLSLFTKPCIPEGLSLQVKISNFHLFKLANITSSIISKIVTLCLYDLFFI